MLCSLYALVFNTNQPNSTSEVVQSTYSGRWIHRSTTLDPPMCLVAVVAPLNTKESIQILLFISDQDAIKGNYEKRPQEPNIKDVGKEESAPWDNEGHEGQVGWISGVPKRSRANQSCRRFSRLCRLGISLHFYTQPAYQDHTSDPKQPPQTNARYGA